MNRVGWILAALLVVTASGTIAVAQEEQDDGNNWSNKTELGFTSTTGNSETTNFSFANKYTYDWSNAGLVIDAFALRNETSTRFFANPDGTVRVDSVKEKTAEQYGLAGKYSHTIREALSWYASARWFRNRFAGIDDRYIGGAGLAYRFFDTDKHRLVGEAGLDYTEENRIDGTSDSWAGARLFGGYLLKFGAKSEFSSELEGLYNFDETDDWRVNWINSVTTTMTDRLALKVSYAMLYDNQPVIVLVEPDDTAPPGTPSAPFEFDELDTILTASLVINF